MQQVKISCRNFSDHERKVDVVLCVYIARMFVYVFVCLLLCRESVRSPEADDSI